MNSRRTAAAIGGGVLAVAALSSTITYSQTGNRHRRPPAVTSSTKVTTTIKPTTTTLYQPPTTNPVTTPSTIVTTTTAAQTGCVGTKVSPGANLSTIISAAAGGTIFCLAPGSYPQTSAMLMKTGDKIYGSGALLDFSNVSTSYCVYGYGGASGQSNVTVDGLDISRCAGIALKEGDNWTVKNVYVHDSAIGMTGACDGCRILHNAEYGITDATTVSNTEIGWNGGVPDSGGSTGGNKNVHLSNTHWVDDYVHDNAGPGIWCDGCWTGSVFDVKGGRYINNKDAGIDYEISFGGLVDGAFLQGNAWNVLGQSCWWGSQISINNSVNVVVQNSTIDSSGGENAICLSDSYRPGDAAPTYPQLVTPFAAKNNTIVLAGLAQLGVVGNNNGGPISTFSACTTSSNNVCFDNNTYHTDGSNHWTFNSNNALSWAGWQSLNEDIHSTIGP